MAVLTKWNAFRACAKTLKRLWSVPFFAARRLCYTKHSTKRKTVSATLFVIAFLSVASLVLRDSADRPLRTSTHTYFDQHVVPVARSKWKRAAAASRVDGLPLDHWSSVKDDVVIGIKTGHEVAKERIEKLRTVGWWSVGRDVPNIIGISDEDDIELGVVGIKRYALDLLRVNNFSRKTNEQLKPVRGDMFSEADSPPSKWFDSSGWKGDKDKNLPALHMLRTLFPGKRWYLLLDDDTYIFLENFAHFILKQGMDENPVYTGKVFLMSHCGGFGRDGFLKANRSEPRGVFAHGGSGIVINSLAMDRVFPKLGDCIREYSSCWAGDIQVGLCMRDVGVGLHNYIPRKKTELHFFQYSPSKAMGASVFAKRWRSGQEPLTFHKIGKEEELIVSEFERQSMMGGRPFVYNRLLDFLMRNDVKPYQPKKKNHKSYTTAYLPHGNETGVELAERIFPDGLL